MSAVPLSRGPLEMARGQGELLQYLFPHCLSLSFLAVWAISLSLDLIVHC